jgi:HEPN domain-containing protein
LSIEPPHELWLAKAHEDLEIGRLCFREGYFAQACFLSQQTAEKSLKSVPLCEARLISTQHKIIKLASLCSELKTDLDPIKDEFKLIDEFYIPIRYPDSIPGGLPGGLPNEDDAKKALDTAAAVLELVRARI